MGQSESSFQRTYTETVSQLSSVQLGEIAARFNELYGKAGGPRGHVVDREAFSRYFRLPVAVGDRLFDAFDRKKNGKISFEEFVCGLAILLHGSFSDKCKILFQVFNIHGDEGIGRAELTTMLSAIQQSTNTILSSVSDSDDAVMYGENREQAVKRMVDAAFKNCDITRTGKLLPLEFEYWLKHNPKVLDCLLAFGTREEVCTLGPLLMTSSSSTSITPPSSHTITTSHHPTSTSHTPSQHTSTPLEVSHHSQALAPVVMATTATSFISMATTVTSAISMTTTVTPAVSMATADPPISQESVQLADHQMEPVSPVVVTMDPSSPTLIQLVTSGSDPSVEGKEEQLTDILPSTSPVSGMSVDNSGKTDIEFKEKSLEDVNVEFSEELLEGVEEPLEEVEEPLEAVEEPLEGVEEPLEGVEEPLEGVEEPLEEVEEPLEAVEELVEGVEEPPEAVEEPVGYGGSIMQSEDSFIATQRLDLAEVVQALSSTDIEPSSPVLPTTMETIYVEEEEEEENTVGDDEGELLSFSVNELAESEVEEAAVRSRSISETLPEVTTNLSPEEELTAEEPTGEDQPSQKATVDTTIQQDGDLDTVTVTPEVTTATQEVIHEPPPPRRPSPYPEGEAEVKEILYTAWLPSARTQELLGSSSSSMNTQHLTCPGLVTDIRTHDPIGDLLSSKFPDIPRKPLLSVEHVSMDAEGLRRLVAAGCHHAALELTSRFLSAHGQGLGQAGQPTMHTHKTLQMWAARAALLVHLRRYKDAELELTAFRELDNPDLYYQYHVHSYPGKTGSLVPFSLRLLHAQLPIHTGSPQLSLDRLCTLQVVCEQILSELKQSRLPWIQEPLSAEDQQAAEAIWRERLVRVKFFLGNCFVALQDYSMAVKVYESIIEKAPSLKAELCSGIGRLYLQLGDLQSAQKYFGRVGTTASEDPTKLIHVKINEALVNVFLSKWQSARDCFDAALHMDPNNMMVQSNIATCVFFQGRLKEAVSHMESLLYSRPPLSLQPGVFGNLSAAYDLESGASQAKKQAFLPLLGQMVGEGFHLPSLNIR